MASPLKNYIVVILLEDMEAGEPFQSWPLHITLSPIFTTNDISTVMAELEIIAGHYSTFNVVASDISWFGTKHDIPVITVTSETLHDLHTEVYYALESTNLPSSSTWLDNYRPHITIKRHPGPPFQPGEFIEINSFRLFEYTDYTAKTKLQLKDFQLVAAGGFEPPT